jgi:hypothetical protein
MRVILVLGALLFFLPYNDKHSDLCRCPVNMGVTVSPSLSICRGNSVNALVKGDSEDRSVYAMISGQVAQINDSMGSVTIASDSLLLKYWVMDRKVSLTIGDSIQYGEEIGALSEHFNQIRIDLLSGRRDSFFSLLEDACPG